MITLIIKGRYFDMTYRTAFGLLLLDSAISIALGAWLHSLVR